MRVHNAPPNSTYTCIDNRCLRDKNLSNKAKGLLCTMLSMSEYWQFSVKGLAAVCKDGEDAIRNQLLELERNGYLVRKQVRDKNGRIARSTYYLYDAPQLETPVPAEQDAAAPAPEFPQEDVAAAAAEGTESPAEDQQPDAQANNADGREQQAEPDAENPALEGQGEVQSSHAPEPENSPEETPSRENPMVENSAQRNTKERNNKERSTNKINQSYPSSFPLEPDRSAEEQPGSSDAMDGYDSARACQHRLDVEEQVRENVDYDSLKVMMPERNFSIARELVGLMVDTICTTMPYVRVGREEMPAEVVRSRLLKLNSTHIEHVVDSINRNTTMVRNIRQYMLTSLFNSVNSAACSLTIQVNHDMYGCGDSTEKRR